MVQAWCRCFGQQRIGEAGEERGTLEVGGGGRWRRWGRWEKGGVRG